MGWGRASPRTQGVRGPGKEQTDLAISEGTELGGAEGSHSVSPSGAGQAGGRETDAHAAPCSPCLARQGGCPGAHP